MMPFPPDSDPAGIDSCLGYTAKQVNVVCAVQASQAMPHRWIFGPAGAVHCERQTVLDPVH